MRTTDDIMNQLHEEIDGWRPVEREWETVKTLVESVCNECYQDGWKQGLLDARDMISKGINLNIVTQPFQATP